MFIGLLSVLVETVGVRKRNRGRREWEDGGMMKSDGGRESDREREGKREKGGMGVERERERASDNLREKGHNIFLPVFN